jgi:hypothetical protein
VVGGGGSFSQSVRPFMQLPLCSYSFLSREKLDLGHVDRGVQHGCLISSLLQLPIFLES